MQPEWEFLMIQCCSNNVVSSPTPNQDSETLVIDLNTDEFSVLLTSGGSLVTDGNNITNQGLLLFRTTNEVKAFRNDCTHSGYNFNALAMAFQFVPLAI